MSKLALLTLILERETSREKMEQGLEWWIYQFERRGLRVNRTKHQSIHATGEENIKLGDKPIPTVNVFKYLGRIMFAAECGSVIGVNNRLEAAHYAKWIEVSGVMYDKKMPIKINDEIYKNLVKPTMT